jgi:hypothetical protein
VCWVYSCCLSAPNRAREIPLIVDTTVPLVLLQAAATVRWLLCSGYCAAATVQRLLCSGRAVTPLRHGVATMLWLLCS